MHRLQMYENLRDMLEREVKEIEKKAELDPQSLDNLYKVMTAIKATDRCIEREERDMEGMSEGYGRYSEDNFRYSQDRGRNHYGYSRDTVRESMINRLMRMADTAGNENNRMAIMECVDKIR